MLYTIKETKVYVTADKQIVEDIVDYLKFILKSVDTSKMILGYFTVAKKDVFFVNHILNSFKDNAIRQQTIALYRASDAVSNYKKTNELIHLNDAILWARRYYIAANQLTVSEAKQLSDFASIVIDYFDSKDYDALVVAFKQRIKLAA